MINTVYILSAGRSGSTLLNLMLGAHPDAFAVGEITHLPKNLALNTPCMCGSPVRECSAWAPVIGRMSQLMNADLFSNPYAMDLGFIQASRVIDHQKMTRWYKFAGRARHGAIYLTRRLGLPVKVSREFSRSIAQTHLLFKTIREVHGARLLVDSSKAYLKGIALYEHAPAETRLILLSRDGRGVINSEIRSGKPLRSAVRSWKNYYSRTMSLLEKVPPEHVIHVTYEQLATDPVGELRRLSDALDIAYDPVMTRPTKIQHITNGNDTRFSALQVRLDTRWQTELSEESIAYFEATAGAINRRLLCRVPQVL